MKGSQNVVIYWSLSTVFLEQSNTRDQTNLCCVDFAMMSQMLWTCANHSENFVTWKHCVWRVIYDVTLSGEPLLASQIGTSWKTLGM